MPRERRREFRQGDDGPSRSRGKERTKGRLSRGRKASFWGKPRFSSPLSKILSSTRSSPADPEISRISRTSSSRTPITIRATSSGGWRNSTRGWIKTTSGALPQSGNDSKPHDCGARSTPWASCPGWASGRFRSAAQAGLWTKPAARRNSRRIWYPRDYRNDTRGIS